MHLGILTDRSGAYDRNGLWMGKADGRLFAVLGFTIAGGKVVEIDILADPARLGRLDLSAIEG